MDKSKLFGKAWRLIKVIYAIFTIPVVLFFIGEVIDSSDFKINNGYFFDGYLTSLFILAIILGYILFTDILRRILSYIDSGNINGFIPYSKFGIKNTIFFIVGGVIFSTLMIFGSESKRNYCSGEFESVSYSKECVCDFGYKRDKNICIEDVKIYKNNGISFSYPSYLNLSENPFKIFEFFGDENFHVRKNSLQSLVSSCVDSLAEIRSDGDREKQELLKKELFEEYESKILKVQKGEDIYPIDYFDYITCGATSGPINMSQVKSKDGTNGVIINYYFTQDGGEGGCLTQLNTELFLVKNENEIYSIMFRNNFGDFRPFMEDFRVKYSGKLSEEACMVNGNEIDWIYVDSAKKSADDILKYFRNGESLGSVMYDGIEENDKIIQRIIHSVELY